MTSPNTTSLSVLAVVLGALILGATPAALREIDVGSTAAGFWRVALALPVLLGIAALRTRDRN
ncbi:MAG: EamA family transporter, partial [Gammaproteobacteria bacterium]|nr:EamA family transporter [Gammaproteobacteria bacterium]